MSKKIAVLIALLCLSASAWAQSLSQSDIDACKAQGSWPTCWKQKPPKQSPPNQSSASPATQNVKPAEMQAGPKIDPEIAAKLLKVRRIYVDSFGDDPVSNQLQAMVADALAESKRFIVTENKDKADAVLRGNGLEKTSQELHAIGEATSVAGAAGSHHGEVSGSVVNGTGSVSGSSNGGFVAHHMATEDSQASTETINDARLAVRLVAADGDVVWATTKESKGAKYKGASADVADQIVKQLLRDLDKIQSGVK